MMSQNRQADRDRHQAHADFETNRTAESEIEDMQADLDRIAGMLQRVLETVEAKQ